jgi:hypothetical protein
MEKNCVKNIGYTSFEGLLDSLLLMWEKGWG